MNTMTWFTIQNNEEITDPEEEPIQSHYDPMCGHDKMVVTNYGNRDNVYSVDSSKKSAENLDKHRISHR